MYYFTFLIVESSCNAAGLGYSGLDDKGNEKWDLARNIDILSFELGTNARQVISPWNIRTIVWIRSNQCFFLFDLYTEALIRVLKLCLGLDEGIKSYL
jgi:hypothetical protein